MKQIILIDTGRKDADEKIRINKRDLIPLHMNNETICSLTFCSNHKIMAELRTAGELENSAIWLNDSFDWQIGKDSQGAIVAIPTRKIKN